jgi:hypothetical protein
VQESYRGERGREFVVDLLSPQEELEAVEPVHVNNETGYYQSRIDRMKEKIEEERYNVERYPDNLSIKYHTSTTVTSGHD